MGVYLIFNENHVYLIYYLCEYNISNIIIYIITYVGYRYGLYLILFQLSDILL